MKTLHFGTRIHETLLETAQRFEEMNHQFVTTVTVSRKIRDALQAPRPNEFYGSVPLERALALEETQRLIDSVPRITLGTPKRGWT